jgi:hypothetical protein
MDGGANTGRTIERQAEGLRRALLVLANGEAGGAEEVARKIQAIRTQLELAERLAADWDPGV